MKKLVAFLLMGVMLLGIAGCGQKQDVEKDPEGGAQAGQKIAYVTGTGGLGDKSFNDLGYEGIKRLMDEGIDCSVAEPKAVSEIEGIIRNFADTGEYALIIAMGGEAVDALKSVTQDYPEQPMMVMDGLAGVDTVKSVMFSQPDTGFLVGAYAALMLTEGNLPNARGEKLLGVVGGMDIPLIRSIIIGYECGARFVDPEIQVLTAYVGSWGDPGKGLELTQSLYGQGADIVLQAAGGSGMGVLEASKNNNLYAIGYDGNQNSISPDTILASGARGTAYMIYDTAKAALAGNFQGGDFVIDMKDDPATAQLLLEDSNVTTPESVKEKVEQIKEFLSTSEVAIPDDFADVDNYLSQVGTFQQ